MPTLRVVREDDDGVVITGMKMLATGAVFANEIWIGNLLPLAPNQLAESITCAAAGQRAGRDAVVAQALRAPGDSRSSTSPLAWRFDETDSMVMCENVKVPWERVFVHMDAILARDIYIKTPGHCYGNHQSNVRFHAKMQLIVGLASKIAHASGANEVPAVREVLGRFAALEAALGGMIAGQLHDAEDWPEGYEDLQPALHVRRAQLVHREPLADHRRAARAVRRRRLPDARRHHGDARREARGRCSRPTGRRRSSARSSA